MSVFLAFAITLRPFASRGDPGMPLGLWAVFGSTLGDASAGLLTTAPRFQNAGGPGNSLLYSLEQVAINTTVSGGGINVSMAVANMDFLPLSGSTGARSEVHVFSLQDNGAALGSSLRPDLAIIKPIFLGAPRQNGLSSGINFAMTNTAAISLAVKAQGYYWSPGAINAIGGPQRPPGSIYGT